MASSSGQLATIGRGQSSVSGSKVVGSDSMSSVARSSQPVAPPSVPNTQVRPEADTHVSPTRAFDGGHTGSVVVAGGAQSSDCGSPAVFTDSTSSVSTLSHAGRLLP
ncbi:unannotated protein [freshwater metagenome]|uniref:Unannotated protein n=1 Tax=freshwater metagenome TaxID=449393 RepID=A0A6J6FVF5_9ZZZZ